MTTLDSFVELNEQIYFHAKEAGHPAVVPSNTSDTFGYACNADGCTETWAISIATLRKVPWSIQDAAKTIPGQQALGKLLVSSIPGSGPGEPPDMMRRVDAVFERFGDDLSHLQERYIGKHGELAGILEDMSTLSSEDRRRVGNRLNDLVDAIKATINRGHHLLGEASEQQVPREDPRPALKLGREENKLARIWATAPDVTAAFGTLPAKDPKLV